jgi:hypothetical protein
MIEKVYRSSCEVPLSLSDCNESNFLGRFSKKKRKVAVLNFSKILPLRAELFHVDGRTDGHDEANGRFSQFCEKRPKVSHNLSIGSAQEI